MLDQTFVEEQPIIGRMIEPVKAGTYREELEGIPIGWGGLFTALGGSVGAFERQATLAVLGLPDASDVEVGIYVPKRGSIDRGVLFYTPGRPMGITDSEPEPNAIMLIPDEEGGNFLMSEARSVSSGQIERGWQRISLEEAHETMDSKIRWSLEDEVEMSLLMRHPDVSSFKSPDNVGEGVYARLDPKGRLELVIQKVTTMKEGKIDAARMVLVPDGRNNLTMYPETRALAEGEF